MKRLLTILTALLAFVLAAPAAAAPLDLGTGARPSVVVDAAGTAHVAYQGENAQIYCRLPRNARACNVRTVLPLIGDTHLGGPTLLERSDGTLLLVVSTNARLTVDDGFGITYLRTSSDSGATWSDPAVIATGTYAHSAVALAPSGQAVYTLDPDGRALDFQRAPFGGLERRVVDLAGSRFPGDRARLAVLEDGRILVLDGRLGRSTWRLFGGGDELDFTAWATRGTVETWEPELASGPRGTFLLDHRSHVAQGTGKFAAPFAIRAFDARRGRWRPARTAGADRSVFGSSSFFQDARGRLHIIADSPGPTRTNCVLYTRTSPAGWFGRTTVLYKTNRNDREPRRVRASAGPDGRGIAVWDDLSGHVWATPLKQDKGKYHPRRLQRDRPACTGKRYLPPRR